MYFWWRRLWSWATNVWASREHAGLWRAMCIHWSWLHAEWSMYARKAPTEKRSTALLWRNLCTVCFSPNLWHFSSTWYREWKKRKAVMQWYWGALRSPSLWVTITVLSQHWTRRACLREQRYKERWQGSRKKTDEWIWQSGIWVAHEHDQWLYGRCKERVWEYSFYGHLFFLYEHLAKNQRFLNIKKKKQICE